jgi:hypothetical protein
LLNQALSWMREAVTRIEPSGVSAIESGQRRLGSATSGRVRSPLGIVRQKVLGGDAVEHRASQRLISNREPGKDTPQGTLHVRHTFPSALECGYDRA